MPCLQNCRGSGLREIPKKTWLSDPFVGIDPARWFPRRRKLLIAFDFATGTTDA
jgi:hypothetical protein